MKARAWNARARRVAGSVVVASIFFLEGKCGSGQPAGAPSNGPAPASAASPSSSSREIPSSILSAYEAARIKAWDPSRRFKALFKAEVSPKVGAVGRGYLSVWWDGARGELEWRASAPIAGAGRGGVLRMSVGGAGEAREGASPLAVRLAAPDLISCILGTPNAALRPSSPFEETPRGLRLRVDSSNRTVLIDERGKPIELSFPSGETVSLEPGEGVPRRIEAKGRDGRAILMLESYSPWPTSEEIPPP